MFDQSLANIIFGRLTWESFPIHEPILLVTFAVVVVGGLAIVGLVTKYKLWDWLWREWLTRRSVEVYLARGTSYWLREDGAIANPDQRIADDVRTSLPALSRSRWWC